MAKKGAKLELVPPADNRKVIRITSESAQLQHINHRTEGNKEAPVRALDLKFKCVVPSALLQTLCGSDDVPPLWNSDGSLRYVGLTNFNHRAILKDCKFEFGDIVQKPIKLAGVKAKGFVFNLAQGNALQLTFKVQISNPTDAELLELSHAILLTAQLLIECEFGIVLGDDKDEDQGTLLEDEE